MSYTALYRKFRPTAFDQVRGQEHIVTTLKNQIKADRIGHAYLFCGTRGTGKTTVAKILARAVNCENSKDGSPCNECRICKSIGASVSMDVTEIDAASNNGVDNIREIKEAVSYPPTEGRFKVYIIDEVHMLSIGAFNALLKTLEEPPEYVIFILATTEVNKIPVTILSRCQRYDFRRISIHTIAEYLIELVQSEGMDAEEKAVRYVAKMADGSLRDALSLLDQCIAFYSGQTLTYENALEVLGTVDTSVFSDLLRDIIQNNITGAIHLVEQVVMQGRELTQFVLDFTWYMRNLLLVKTSDEVEDVLDVSAEAYERLAEEAKQIGADTLIRNIRIFSELSNQIKYSAQKRIEIEIAIIKLCTPQMETDQISVLERIRVIEEKIASGSFVKKGSPHAANEAAEGRGEIGQRQPEKMERELPAALNEDLKEIVTGWRGIISSAPGVLRTYLRDAKLSLGDNNHLLLVFQDEIAESYVSHQEQKEKIVRMISEKIGKTAEVDIKLQADKTAFQDDYIDLEKIIHMEISVEE